MYACGRHEFMHSNLFIFHRELCRSLYITLRQLRIFFPLASSQFISFHTTPHKSPLLCRILFIYSNFIIAAAFHNVVGCQNNLCASKKKQIVIVWLKWNKAPYFAFFHFLIYATQTTFFLCLRFFSPIGCNNHTIPKILVAWCLWNVIFLKNPWSP